MRFTDAHSSSGICSPVDLLFLRALTIGEINSVSYNRLASPFSKKVMLPFRRCFKNNGYQTACIGKWHLGWDWNFKNEPSGEVVQWGKDTKFYLPEDIDWTVPITGGPLDRGFDYYFGDGTINFPPYAWVENDQFVELPTKDQDIHKGGFDTEEGNWEFRPGPMVEGWDPYKVLPTLTKKAVEYVNSQEKNKPFFRIWHFPHRMHQLFLTMSLLESLQQVATGILWFRRTGCWSSSKSFEREGTG